jgi:predicted nuclease of predicted toxin-antitoxin system
MRLLLDESVPVRLRDHLPQHQVFTVQEMGWGGSTNGALLVLAAQRFDALITADRNLQYQQNLQSLPVAVVVICANSNTLRAFVPLIGKLELALRSLLPRSLLVVKE